MGPDDWTEYSSFCTIPFHRSGSPRVTHLIKHYTQQGAIITHIWWKPNDTSGNDICHTHGDAAYHYELKIEGIRRKNQSSTPMNNMFSRLTKLSKSIVNRHSNTVPFVDTWVDSGYVCSHGDGFYYLVCSEICGTS